MNDTPQRRGDVTSLVLDPIFFGKGDVFPGTRIVYAGRRAPGQVWTVHSIHTPMPKKEDTDERSFEKIDHVRTLQDLIFLRHGAEERVAVFGYLSYSAIWRIET